MSLQGLENVGAGCRFNEMLRDVEFEDRFEVGEPSIWDETKDGDDSVEDSVAQLTICVCFGSEDAEESVEDIPERETTDE